MKDKTFTQKIWRGGHEGKFYNEVVQTIEQNLTVVPTMVPRGRGNNPYGGKRDLHYKIKEWGFVFPTKADAEKYAKEHIGSVGGQIFERKKILKKKLKGKKK